MALFLQHVVEMQRLARSVSLLWAPQVPAGAAERVSLAAMAVSVASVPPPQDPPQDPPQAPRDFRLHFPAPASR